MLPACAESGIGFVPFNPIRKGFLTGTTCATASFGAGEIRATVPRCESEKLAADQNLAEHVRALADRRGELSLDHG